MADQGQKKASWAVLSKDNKARTEVNHNVSTSDADVSPGDGTTLNQQAGTNTTSEQEYPLVVANHQANQNALLWKESEGAKDVQISMGGPGREEDRETWDKKIDFLLSIIGFAVDLANVWRFPYLCYKNGGGAFLIPYFLMLFFGAIPLFFMELALGQFHRQGAIGVWKIAPLFKGIGMCECLIAYYVAFYYNVIIAWALYYLIQSFTWTLPWTLCDHDYNTPLCYSPSSPNVSGLVNGTVNFTDHSILTNDSVASAAEYFERGVLGLHHSPGLGELGPPRWQLFLCLFVVFIMLFLALSKGVKSSGKVVWVTATMPYVVLTLLLIRGVLLPGAKEGILYFITPRVDRLGDVQVWIDAAVQIFYSVGAGFGVHIAYASYNKFNNNIYKDCIATVCVNSFTSLFSGIVIFCYLGYMATAQDKLIEDVAKEGPGLVFMVYPEAIATLPGSVFWSILFFIMLITLGLDSAMGGLEAVLTGLRDEFNVTINKYKYGREALTACICGSAFLFSLQNITNGGVYLFTMWDRFAAGTAILFGVFMQAIAVSWFYGLEQFCQDIEKMMGFRPNFYWRICWKFISPMFLFIIIVSSMASFEPLSYRSHTWGLYTYPDWANVVGWAIAITSMALIPVAAIYQVWCLPGSLKQLDFRRQNLTSVDVRFRRLQSIPALDWRYPSHHNGNIEPYSKDRPPHAFSENTGFPFEEDEALCANVWCQLEREGHL